MEKSVKEVRIVDLSRITLTVVISASPPEPGSYPEGLTIERLGTDDSAQFRLAGSLRVVCDALRLRGMDRDLAFVLDQYGLPRSSLSRGHLA